MLGFFFWKALSTFLRSFGSAGVEAQPSSVTTVLLCDTEAETLALFSAMKDATIANATSTLTRAIRFRMLIFSIDVRFRIGERDSDAKRPVSRAVVCPVQGRPAGSGCFPASSVGHLLSSRFSAAQKSKKRPGGAVAPGPGAHGVGECDGRRPSRAWWQVDSLILLLLIPKRRFMPFVRSPRGPAPPTGHVAQRLLSL